MEISDIGNSKCKGPKASHDLQGWRGLLFLDLSLVPKPAPDTKECPVKTA